MSLRHLTRYGMQVCFTKSKDASHPIYNHKIVSTTKKTFRIKYGEAVMQLKKINSRQRVGTGAVSAIHHRSSTVVLGIATITYAGNIAILATHNNYVEASLQESLFYIQE